MRAETSLARYLRWATYSRFKPVRDFAWKLVRPEAHIFSPSDSAVRILVGGDVAFDLELRTPRQVGVYFVEENKSEHWILKDLRRRLWRALCGFFFSPRLFATKIKLVTFREPLAKILENEKRRETWRGRQKENGFDIDFSSATSKSAYPFQKIAPLLKEKDLVLVNLETPLTGHHRVRGLLCSDPAYAQEMKKAGISMVSLANNHIFDAEEVGFLETLVHLEKAGIPFTGAGKDFQDARLGRLVQLDGLSLIFLSYTQFCNSGFASIAAEYPGTLPLDTQLIVEDIQTARPKADFVFVSLHWGYEDQPNVHPRQVEIARALIDAGADGIIGHHPHVPHGIEVYKQRPILYSLGNFIFGQTMEGWSDNYLAEIVIEHKQIRGIIVYPISGRGRELFQPELLTGARADSLLNELRIKSATFNTGIAIQNHLGFVKIE